MNVNELIFVKTNVNEILVDEEVVLFNIKSNVSEVTITEKEGEVEIRFDSNDASFLENRNLKDMKQLGIPMKIYSDKKIIKDKDMQFLITGVRVAWDSNIILDLKPYQESDKKVAI